MENIETFKVELEELEKNEKIYSDQVQNEEKKLEELYEEKRQVKIKIEELNEKVENGQDYKLEAAKMEEQLNSSINILDERILNSEENIKKIDIEIVETKEKIEKLEDETKDRNEKKKTLLEEKNQYEKELNEKLEELDIILKKLSTEEKSIEEKKKTVEVNTDNKYEVLGKINILEANIENNQTRNVQINDEISSNIKELDSYKISTEDILKDFHEIDSKRNSLKEKLEETEKEKDIISNEINSFDEKINALLSENRIKKSRLDFLIETEREKEGYAISVRKMLLDCKNDKNIAKGLKGSVADLINVEEKYQRAIEIALGGYLQNVVTENETDAKKLIEYLKEKKYGRVSFLPKNNIKGSKISIKTNNSVFGIAADLIKYDKEYDQIMLNLLGRTVIVDNLDTAIEFAKQNKNVSKIVTLEGEIINASGQLTGGYTPKRTVNILGRKQEIDSIKIELEKQLEQIKQKELEKENYILRSQNVIDKVKEIETDIQSIEVDHATKKQKNDLIEEEILKLQSKLQKLRNEKDELSNNKKEATLEKEILEKEIIVFDDENKLLNKFISDFNEKNIDSQNAIDDLNFDITNLKISVGSFDESELSIDELLDRIKTEVEESKKSVIEKENNKQNLKKLKEELKIQIEEVNEKLIELSNKNEDNKEYLEKIKLERSEKNKRLEELDVYLEELIIVISDLKEKVSKLEIRKNKYNLDLDLVINKLWEEYELTPNNVLEYNKPNNIKEAQKQVNKLRSEIKELGNINIDSIEEYKNAKERYTFMLDQKEDLELSITNLRKIISEMIEVMKKQFMEQFKKINSNFGDVFKELFNGGKASLKLLDEDNVLECGIDIEVQPPGKRLQNMMLLSGGERAFTAIALLFAILRLNPSPFCVLDEIEAALDEVNVYRFAEYLKKFSNNTQFLLITHRKGTMEVADTVYGITMEEKGISKLLSIKL